MKKSFIAMILVFILTGCSSVERVTVYRMENFTDIDESSLITFTDTKVVKDFVTAFKTAKKESGIVDIAEPEFKVELGEEEYFLWINEEHGTIMNVKDTHTISTLSARSAKALSSYLKIKE